MSIVPFQCRLPNRSLLRISGVDAHEYLQGLFTNDLRQLQPAGSMWGCFLHFNGRVLCDARLYQSRRTYQGQASILVDVHRRVAAELTDMLLEMKMRKKVQIQDVSTELAVLTSLHSATAKAAGTPTIMEEAQSEDFVDPFNFALFSSSPTPQGVAKSSCTSTATAAASVVPSTPPWSLHRRIVPHVWSPSSTLSVDGVSAYESLLFSRGIGEGPNVFQPSKTLPFEANADFLDGVSFHKGCYVGQELTHRTHVMLITRKRTVPLRFGPAVETPSQWPNDDAAAADEAKAGSSESSGRPVIGDGLFSKNGDRIGEITGVCRQYGIGLLRLRFVEKATQEVPGMQLKSGEPVSTKLPDWWPAKEVRKILKNNL